MTRILIVRGASAVGKTTAVRRLRRDLAGGATVEVDDLWATLCPPGWHDAAEVARAGRLTATLVAALRQEGRDPIVVLDGAWSLWGSSLPQAAVDCALWARPDVLSARMASRAPGGFRDEALALERNRRVEDLRHTSVPWLDTSDLGPADVARWLAALITDLAADDSSDSSNAGRKLLDKPGAPP